jgi:colanic acid biosynthesis glycosyl transferase WcaI
MRVAFHTQYYPPEMGAPQARLSELATRLVCRGHEVWALTAMPNYPTGRIFAGYGGLLRHEVLDGVKVVRTFVHPAQSVRIAPRLLSYFSFVASSAAVGTFALPRGLDYVITESPPLFLGLAGWWLSRVKRARWIFNVSDLWPESAVRLGVIGDGAALRAARRLEAFCYRRAWLVSGQSRGILADISARFPEVTTHHLSNGVDPAMFTPDAATSATGEGLGEPGEVVALYTGLHGIAQGLGQLVEAAELLRGERGLRISLVGDGPEKKRLVEMVHDKGLANVRFLAPQPRRRMPALTASADIGVACLAGPIPGAVPSKIYETMAAGRPLLLVADGEAAEIVHECGCGVVVRPGDVAGIASALSTLAASPDLRRSMGARGRETAMRRFDRDRIVGGFIDRLEVGLQ